MLYDILMTIEDSALGTYVRESSWGFAIALSCHAIGMALSLGVMMIINFRILGFLKQIPVMAHADLFGTAWLGFIVNFISGVALYTSHPTKYSYEWIFGLKLLLLALGGWFMKLTMDALRANSPEDKVKLLSGITISCWVGAVITGRLMAYFYSSV